MEPSAPAAPRRQRGYTRPIWYAEDLGHGSGDGRPETHRAAGARCDTGTMQHGDQSESPDPAGEQHEQGLFVLHVRIRHGRHLPAMDSCGTSDPYIKFKICSKTVYKSKVVHKTLNPVWDEAFRIYLRDQFQKLRLKVYDHDWGINDDFLGEGSIDLSTLPLHQEQDLALPLYVPGSRSERGTVTLSVRIEAKSRFEMLQLTGGATVKEDKKEKDLYWSHVVNVVLVEANNLLAMDAEHTSDPYVKFRLGKEKYKSKAVGHSLNPQWLEQFSMYLYDTGSQCLHLEVFDHDARTTDDFLGKCSVDLSRLAKEKTHKVRVNLVEGTGSVLLLITISGTARVGTATDLLDYQEDVAETEKQRKEFRLLNTCSRPSLVGRLTVKVFKARGLAAADIGGTSDPFCVLELVNQRLQTQTLYKTLTPHWNKIFHFDVKDIHSVLEVTVYDQDRDHQVDFLGKVVIPLLEIQCGKKLWYSLKDEQLRHRAKGDSPQILLEANIVWNPARAALRTFTPREQKYARPPVRFQRAVFIRHVNRLVALSSRAVQFGAFLRSVLLWESREKTLMAYGVFLIVTYFFEPYMVPACLLVFFFERWLVRLSRSRSRTSGNDQSDSEEDEDDEGDEDDTSSESLNVEWRYWRYLPDEKKTLKEKMLAVQEVMALVQSTLGFVVSLVECLLNVVNFAVPFLSWLALALLVASMVALFFIPVRYAIMLLGTFVFFKPLLWPDAALNNELLSFLSRVPDDNQMRQRRQLGPAPLSESCRRRRQRARYGMPTYRGLL